MSQNAFPTTVTTGAWLSVSFLVEVMSRGNRVGIQLKTVVRISHHLASAGTSQTTIPGLGLPYVAISAAATLAFPLTLRVLMELLAGTMLALLSHDRLSRYCKARAKSSNKTEISYFHSLPFFPIFIYSDRAGVNVELYMCRTSPDFHVGPRVTRHYWLHDFLNETGR